MAWLILGLVLFLGAHSVRIAAEDWRTAMRARLGAGAWKGLYSLVSIAGFGLIVWGFGQARLDPQVMWVPPLPMRHIAALLVLVAFIFLAAAYVPRNAIKSRLHHPMVLSVKVWALAHLLANGKLADIVLFGAFLLWAVLDFRSARQRDRAAGTLYPQGTMAGTLATVAVGVAAWAGFAFWGHQWLIGVAPLGR
jgi:uncharacterized membrane protein